MIDAKILLFFLSIGILFSETDACQCDDIHPQEQFCNSQYAIKVLILSTRRVVFEDEVPVDSDPDDFMQWGSQWHEYTVRVVKTYKGEIQQHATNKVYSPFLSSVCGTYLKDGHYYMLIGDFNEYGNIHIELCNYNFEITHLNYLTSRLLAENLLRNWQKGCNKCTICSSEYRYCPETKFCKSPEAEDTLAASLSYCHPNKSDECRMWRYDVDSLADGRKNKYKKQRPQPQ